jgi:hypothetical protein
VLSSWQGVYRVPPPEPEEPLKKETAESLLRRLMEDVEDAAAGVIYILAVMLERNRIFIERDVQPREDGTLLRIYEHKKTGETFLVPDPRLRLGELEEVQQRVVEMLGGPPKKPGDATEPDAAEPGGVTSAREAPPAAAASPAGQ